MDLEYDRDIKELRAQFAAVDTRRPAHLRNWFINHPYLSLGDTALIADVCLNTVLDWRRAAGIKSRPIKPPKFFSGRRAALPPAPPGWDTDWVIDQYDAGHSLWQIAIAAGVSVIAIYKRMKRRKKNLRSVKDSARSRHPARTRAWVFDHYVVQHLSMVQCAKIAGVSRFTFRTWLNHFGIRARSASEQNLLVYNGNLGSKAGPFFESSRARQRRKNLAG